MDYTIGSHRPDVLGTAPSPGQSGSLTGYRHLSMLAIPCCWRSAPGIRSPPSPVSMQAPHPMTSRRYRRCPIPSRTVSDHEFWLAAVGNLWIQNTVIDWQAFYGDEDRRRIPLPTYAFDRHRYWVDPDPGAMGSGTAGGFASSPQETAAAMDMTVETADSGPACRSRPPRTSSEASGRECWEPARSAPMTISSTSAATRSGDRRSSTG